MKKPGLSVGSIVMMLVTAFVVVGMAAQPHLRNELVHRLLPAAENPGEVPPQKSRILPHGHSFFS